MYKSSNLKVLYLPSWYPDKNNPKHGIYFKEQASQLNSNVSIYLLNIKRIFYKNIIPNLTNFFLNDNKIVTYNFKYYDFIFKNNDKRINLYEKVILKCFAKIIKDVDKIDLIHAQVTYPAGYGAYIISKEYNIPFIVTEHSSNFERNYNLLNKCYKSVLENASYYTAVSNFVKNKITKYRKQCEITPNFIDFNKFNDVPDYIQWNYADKFNLINISDIEKLKGIDTLLESLNIVVNKKKVKEIFLHILGDGEQLNEYKKLSKKLNINENCKFYGLIEYNKIPQIINKCNALVIASRVETFGIVGIEAMALGLPVISTNCGGPSDYINNENGILVKSESAQDLADGIIKLYSNYNRYSIGEIRKYCQKNYSGDVVAEKIIDVYREVLKK